MGGSLRGLGRCSRPNQPRGLKRKFVRPTLCRGKGPFRLLKPRTSSGPVSPTQDRCGQQSPEARQTQSGAECLQWGQGAGSPGQWSGPPGIPARPRRVRSGRNVSPNIPGGNQQHSGEEFATGRGQSCRSRAKGPPRSRHRVCGSGFAWFVAVKKFLGGFLPSRWVLSDPGTGRAGQQRQFHCAQQKFLGGRLVGVSCQRSPRSSGSLERLRSFGVGYAAEIFGGKIQKNSVAIVMVCWVPPESGNRRQWWSMPVFFSAKHTIVVEKNTSQRGSSYAVETASGRMYWRDIWHS